MILTGAVVNALAVFAGSAVGLLLKKGFPERMGDSIMKGLSMHPSLPPLSEHRPSRCVPDRNTSGSAAVLE